MKLGRGDPAASNLRITYIVDSRHYMYSDVDILRVIETDDALVNNDQKTAPFHENSFRRHARAPLDELHACHLEQDQEKFPSFSSFLETKIQQLKLISHSIMCLFISTTRTFDYNAGNKSEKMEAEDEMWEKRLFLKVERNFSLVESFSFN